MIVYSHFFVSQTTDATSSSDSRESAHETNSSEINVELGGILEKTLSNSCTVSNHHLKLDIIL